jgi:hypothetical protein
MLIFLREEGVDREGIARRMDGVLLGLGEGIKRRI